MKKLAIILILLFIPAVALAPTPKVCHRFQRKCQKQYENPSGAFLRSLVTKEMRECLADYSCEMREQVLSNITYNEVVVEDLRRMSIILSNTIKEVQQRNNTPINVESE